MRYHYKKPTIYLNKYGIKYECDHPVYSSCTLYLIDNKGLAVIQQKFNPEDKSVTWGPVDDSLTDVLYLHPNFKQYHDVYSKVAADGLYPTVTLRQIMWQLKMKPLKREVWETYFDRAPI